MNTNGTTRTLMEGFMLNTFAVVVALFCFQLKW